MARTKKVTSESIDTQLGNLGLRIRELRLKKGYTNYEFFAYENKVGRSQYAKYEKGTDMHFSSILKIIEAHGMTVREFFSEGFDRPKSQ
jgi:transcriptional regulator with XRE-family HTH domain